MEGADQVLALTRIDAGLAADRGIDLRQQRCRHLHEIQPAPYARRRKAGEIADDAAAERDHQIAALDARRDDRLADFFKRGVVLRTLAGRYLQRRTFNAGRLERALDGIEMSLCYRLVGKNECPGGRPQRLDARPQRFNRAASDRNVVCARAQRDRHDGFLRGFGGRFQRGHGFFSNSALISRCFGKAATISSTIMSCGSSRDCTVMSDNA